MVFSKTRRSILPGLPGAVYACHHGTIISLNYPEVVLGNTISYKVTLSKCHNNLTTAMLSSFALNRNYNCIGIDMPHND